MFLSIFEIFKIGIGPSSSHTMGPMVAAARFLSDLPDACRSRGATPHGLTCTLYGSLAYTGKGHATDRAVVLGLMGYGPETLDPDQSDTLLGGITRSQQLDLPGLNTIHFAPEDHVIFDYGPALDGHANGMILCCRDNQDAVILEQTYYSIGGGFVVTELELSESRDDSRPHEEKALIGVPHPFTTAAEMLQMGVATGKSIARMTYENETYHMPTPDFETRLWNVWEVMNACIDRGLRVEGELPGGLAVQRRAKSICEQLHAEQDGNMRQPHSGTEWLNVYAMAVNEENAAGSRVVTSPTNGAAGVVPAVLRYYRTHCIGATDKGVQDFLLTAAAIAGIIKHNASISGAEVGCQGEVGSASAMAAAGLCAALGGSNMQIENAAEIALEHHLGMTCDPVNGLVQVPCIERNGLAAVKAVSAAALSLRGDGTHVMPLDACIETMRQTGLDMGEKYKETSLGGLAINFPAC